jgi:hypothetical protein
MWDKFKLWSMIFTSELKSFLVPLLKIYLTEAGKQLLYVAFGAVKIMAQRDIPNDERHKMASEMIETELKRRGLELGTSLINSAIETAVIRLKSER